MSEDASVGPEERLARAMGAAIRAHREKAGLSMRELGRRTGVSQAFLSQIERGASAPSMYTLYKLAEALETVPGALLPSDVPDPVVVVRAGEGELMPVADHPDAAVGRAVLMRPDAVLEVTEFRLESGQYAQDWWAVAGEAAIYMLEGQLDVEFEGHGTRRIGPHDLLGYPAQLRNRWFLVDDRPAHFLLTMAHPERA